MAVSKDADADEIEEAAGQRTARVHRLGNLALVTSPLNSSLSNAPWVAPDGSADKRTELGKHSVLLLNQRLCQRASWDETTIDERGANLTEQILGTWPGPDSQLWDPSKEMLALLAEGEQEAEVHA